MVEIKNVVKFLRDELMEQVDAVGVKFIEGVRPSPQHIMKLDRLVADYKNLMTTGAITLDTLSRMDNHARQKAKAGKVRRGKST